MNIAITRIITFAYFLRTLSGDLHQTETYYNVALVEVDQAVIRFLFRLPAPESFEEKTSGCGQDRRHLEEVRVDENSGRDADDDEEVEEQLAETENL